MRSVSSGRGARSMQGEHDKGNGAIKSKEELNEKRASQGGEESDDEEDYEDVNEDDDLEGVSVVSLFDNKMFDSVHAMLEQCKKVYDFDLAKLQKDQKLEFMDLVKLVNYVRQEVKNGRGRRSLNLSTKSAFEDDRYLRPVLEDDALLYSLDDIIEGGLTPQETNGAELPVTDGFEEGSAAYNKISELHQTLLRTQQLLLATQQRLELAEKALSSSKGLDDDMGGTVSRLGGVYPSRGDKTYKGNYDGPELHRTMLEDTKRTDAYRDFIQDHSHLFKDKVVLDVGCGTGILSLFCADAGAKLVYGVDQSEDIVAHARLNVHGNGKQNTVKILHGRIQDVTLPSKVDIIVSEWMGYCLLYEAMLDSVIYARDKYLKPSGLMVPSHSTLFIAPMCHPDYRKGKLDFWKNVYSYTMESLASDVIKTVDVDTIVQPSWLCADKRPFLDLDFYKAKVSDLSFRKQSFSFTLDRHVQYLDGFALWFNVIFSPAIPSNEPSDIDKENVHPDSSIVLSTGPEAEPTHWRQGLLLIDRKDLPVSDLQQGQHLVGSISYIKAGEEGLDIKVAWDSIPGEDNGVFDSGKPGYECGSQTWLLQ